MRFILGVIIGSLITASISLAYTWDFQRSLPENFNNGRDQHIQEQLRDTQQQELGNQAVQPVPCK